MSIEMTSFISNSDGVCKKYQYFNIGTCRKKIALCSRNQNSLIKNVFIKTVLGVNKSNWLSF